MQTDCFETVERGHGRVETRRYRTLTDLSGVSRHPLWKAMDMIGMVESTREVNGKCSTETRYFIGSIGADVRTFAGAVREHWGIENKLHWGLDVSFREDDCRVREANARENLAVLRHIAMTRLKQDPAKLGIKSKRLKAGWSESYLENLLFQAPKQPEEKAASETPNIREA